VYRDHLQVQLWISLFGFDAQMLNVPCTTWTLKFHGLCCLNHFLSPGKVILI